MIALDFPRRAFVAGLLLTAPCQPTFAAGMAMDAPGMLALGRQLHMQAGAFQLAAQDATATGDLRKPQQLLGQMMQTCVDCHAVHRLR